MIEALVATDLYARAGGSGGPTGDGGGGGDGDGLRALSYLIFRIFLDPRIPWPIKFGLIGLIGIIGFFSIRAKMNSAKAKTFRGHVGTYVPPKPRALENVDTEGLERKAEIAFMKIQKAWENQDLSDVRRYISDGVYQRFNTQFKMMALLKQSNRLDGVAVNSVNIDKVEKDGPYDIAHLRISAWAKDSFICQIDSSLNQEFEENFVEYWTFMRREGAPKKDMYDSNRCPCCDAPLQSDMGEVGKCAYCDTLINTGEFDWVLAEITQVDDYAAEKAAERLPTFKKNIRNIRKRLPEFCIQLAEDKASNGYLQMLTSTVVKKPEVMRRFVSDKVFDKVSKDVPSGRIVYNRLYLSKVITVGAKIKDDRIDLYMVVGVSSQTVEMLSENEIKKLDEAVYNKNRVIVMSGSINGLGKNGSLFAHNCPSCSGKIEDSLDLRCPYCGTILNSGDHDWVISELYSMKDYLKLRSEAVGQEKKLEPQPVNINSLYGVKDYAFNNMMVIIGADGIFSAPERQMAKEVANGLGFKEDRIKELFQQALARRLTLRMPLNLRDRAKVIALMEKAATVDGNVAAAEAALIEQAKNMAA